MKSINIKPYNNENKINDQNNYEEQENEIILKEFEDSINYKYNQKGELINKKTSKKCQKLSPKEYELVCIYVKKYVENYLIKKFNLTTLYVPNKNIPTDFSIRDDTQAQCKILTTKDFPTNPKCLLLIQGTGGVRLGQWSRSVCINENLDLGTMGPYIDKAIKNNLSVLIFNPNERNDFAYDKNKIEEFSTMQKHCLYVYCNIIRTNPNIKEIYIVAHSKGGECAVELLIYNIDELLSGKIKKIAFTDSAHGNNYKTLGSEGLQKFRQISRNYICSPKPAGTFIMGFETAKKGVSCYSSGHTKHEYTSGTAISEVFKFLLSNEVKQKNKSSNKFQRKKK
jgi:hypothetical protein